MSAAKLLRRAADLVEQRAAQATRGPWTVEESASSWDLYGSSVRADGMVVHPLKIAKAPKQCFVHAEYWPEPGDTAWLLMMGPQLAGPLAAWLRVEADLAENPMCVVVEGAARPLAARVPETAQPFALAMARAILGEVS